MTSAPISLGSSIDFGEVVVGREKAVDLELRSLVDHPMEFSLPRLHRGDLHWYQGSAQLLPRGSHWVTLIYAPASRGRLEEDLHLEVCGECEISVLTARGRAIGSELQVTPGGIDFEVVAVGYSASRSLHLENIGELPLDLDVDTSLLGSSFRAGVEATGYLLKSGGRVSIEVGFSPREGGLKGAPLLLRNRSSTKTQEIRLLGVGGSRLIAIPAQIDFGQIPKGAPSRKEVMLQNIGLPRSIDIVSVRFGSHSPPFHVRGQPVGEEIASMPLSLEVEMTTSEPGIFVSELIVRTTGPLQVLHIPLRGEVIEVPPEEECELVAYPPMLRLGIVPPARAIVRQAFLKNEGQVSCRIREIDVYRFYDFESVARAIGPVDPNLLGPGEVGSFRVVVGPFFHDRLSYGLELGVFLGLSESPGLIVDYSLQGREFVPDVDPAQLIFESIPIRGEEIRSFRISDLRRLNRFVSISLSDDSSAAFELLNPDPLEPGSLVDGLEIEVRYVPSGSGYQHGQVEVYLAEYGEPMRLDLIGVGLEP